MRRWGELEELDGEHGWDRDRWFAALQPYFAEHDTVGIDGDARRAAHVDVHDAGRRSQVPPTPAEPACDHAWAIPAEVALDASEEAGVVVVPVLAGLQHAREGTGASPVPVGCGGGRKRDT